MDYYLIPGADWSLLKKGDTVKVLGKAGGDGRWYRCMAQRREINVKIPDLSLPPASIVNDLLPGAIIGKGSTTNSSSRIQPQVTVEEESLDDVAREEERGNGGRYMYVCIMCGLEKGEESIPLAKHSLLKSPSKHSFLASVVF